MTTQPLQSTRARIRARRRQRGALAVEGVIVAVMMTGIVLGTWYMRKVYSGKLLTIVASRADAWKEALGGCDSGDQGKLYDTIHEQSKDKNNKICKDPKDCSDSSVDGLNDNGSSTPPPDWFPNSASPTVSKSLTVSSDSYSTSLTTTRMFSCNEKPAPRELELGSMDLLSSVIQTVKKIPDEEVQEDTTDQICQRRFGVPIRWQTVSCDESVYKNMHNADPKHWYTRTQDLNPDAPDNSKSD